MALLHRAGCASCGAALTYLDAALELTCVSCGVTRLADVHCEQGHFVCDACHVGDARAIIEQMCTAATETDVLALLRRLRAHPAIPMHGPEHHGLVPAVILATYRNLGGAVDDGEIRAAVDRGFKIPGVFCGRAGACGAAVGVGVAFATLLGSSPVKAEERRLTMEITARVLAKLSEVPAARCCQRDAWVALREAAAISTELLPIPLRAEASWSCAQHPENKQCLGAGCPLWPGC